MQTNKIKIGLISLALLAAVGCAGNNAVQQTQNINRAGTNSGAAANQTATAANAGTSNSGNVTADISIVENVPEVPYVPTHMMVVDKMLEMADVKGTDVLWDLGSGDGRIPVIAAQRFGTRGVGVDIDPQRIKEANENAQKNGVTDKVRFIKDDLFNVDFSEATVVTLYLLPDVNLRLRPKLLELLKPGTRIVSHNYDMGKWQPEKTEVVKTPDNVDHIVYFWRIPENKNELKERLK
ncbi:MAG: methyltransferase domain-containing protein [Acidobacteriota bacterium]|nr:methyltransferase domain-containing protein [Acidobacteriota bacterium]